MAATTFRFPIRAVRPGADRRSGGRSGRRRLSHRRARWPWPATCTRRRATTKRWRCSTVCGSRRVPTRSTSARSSSTARSVCSRSDAAPKPKRPSPSVVASDPMYQPTETEASPRVRTAFSEVRQRQLPDIARTRYASAKSSFDQEGLSGRRTAVSRAASPDRRPRHGRTARRSARCSSPVSSTSARPRRRRRPSRRR